MAARFAGALTVREQEIMARGYWLEFEIEQFNKATTVDGSLQNLNFNAPNFQMMLRNRIAWVEKLRKMGWTREGVAARIMMYYENKRSIRSPFDQLQIEQSPSARERGETDNSIARRLLKLSRVRATFGASYSKGVQTVTVPRNIPKPPLK
jgi:hypothetical protein